MRKKIKLFDPAIGISEEREAVKILRSGYWASGAGSGKVLQFENKFREYLGALRILRTFAIHNVLELRVTCHRSRWFLVRRQLVH